jgi:hypothetical protein
VDSVSTLFARTFLRYVNLDATTRTPSVSLLTVLNEHLIAAGKAMAGGLTVISQTGNGHSYTLIEAKRFSPVQYSEMIGEFLDLYENCKAGLITEGAPTPTDAQIFADMLTYLVPATEVTPDFSGAMR